MSHGHGNAPLHPVFDRITDAYIAFDTEWRYIRVNARAAELTGVPAEDLLGKHVWTEFPEEIGGAFQLACEQAMAEQHPVMLERYSELFGRWLESRLYPSPEGLTVYFLDITQRKRRTLIEEGQRNILADIAAQRPLSESLGRIALLFESLHPDGLCSVLIVDGEGLRTMHGAAPSLPEAYSQSLQGLEIGANVGSCGAAMWRGERVIVGDIAIHPYWEDYRDLALANGLRACWSTPVIGSRGQVLGSFAVYYREVREPGEVELACIDELLPITAIAIESAQLVLALHDRDRFFELSSELFAIFDPIAQRIVQANQTYCRLTGYSLEELTTGQYVDFVHPDDLEKTREYVDGLGQAHERVEDLAIRSKCKDGGYRWIVWSSVTGPDGLAYAVGHDVTDKRRVERALAHAANHDALTGLPNRLQLEAGLEAYLADSREVAVLLLGLDRFDLINESVGHAIGDEVLLHAASRLRHAFGEMGHIARFAGDEFAFAVAGASHAEILGLADFLRRTVAKPMEADKYRLVLTASLGIARSPDHGNRPQELLRRAEAAMAKAKAQGRDSICEFSSDQMRDVEARMQLGKGLRDAVARNQLELHYQPQVHAGNGSLRGFEALLRWNCPGLGQVMPGTFIPIAETMGLMPEIGAWVVDDACRQGRAWMDLGHRDFSISVNICAQELQRPLLAERIGQALDRHALPAQMLGVELTESALMENVPRVSQTLLDLKSLGICVSLDDFGTGYSSLAYLKHFPIDKLKIDQSFVRSLPGDSNDSAIARTIVAMGHQLKMLVSAEGVENDDQRSFLTDIGCDELQGFRLGNPVTASEAVRCFTRPAVQ